MSTAPASRAAALLVCGALACAAREAARTPAARASAAEASAPRSGDETDAAQPDASPSRAPASTRPARVSGVPVTDLTPAEMPPIARGLREPSWPGTQPAARTPTYAQTAAALQRVAARYDPRLRVTFPAPCVLRVTLTQDLSGLREATVRFLHRSTWVDLARVTKLEAKAFGRTRSAEPQLAMTCAWFRGAPGFGLQTEIVTLDGVSEPIRRAELEDESAPRVCVGNEAEPRALADPLRHLVELCGGTAAP
jgi:hypothetical protein